MNLFKRATTPEPSAADINTSPPDALDSLDTDRIGRARALLAADRSLSQQEMEQARVDLEAADRNSIEFEILRAVYSRIDKANDARLQVQIQKQHNDAQEQIAAAKAQRPAMWKALSPLHRAAYITAYESSQAVGEAIMKLVRLLDTDTTASEIPPSFEPRRQ